jgi:hypothetical protein
MRKRKNSKKVINELVRSEQAIREKYKKLKLSKAVADDIATESLKPITEPLKALVKFSEAMNNINTSVRKEPRIKIKQSEDEVSGVRMHNEDNTKGKENHETEQEESKQEEDEEMEIQKEDEKSEIKENNTSHSEELDIEKNKRFEEEASRFGPISKKYFLMHFKGNKTDLDKNYGIYSNGNRWYLGDSQIVISKDSIFFKDDVFTGTPGLFELLFMKKPNIMLYNENDLKIYKKLLLESNAYKQSYDSSKQVYSNKSSKYRNIIRDLVSKNGSGVDLNSVRYEYWDDPNELVDRLRLLVASREAGNNGVDNEIISIIEELRECKIIE